MDEQLLNSLLDQLRNVEAAASAEAARAATRAHLGAVERGMIMRRMSMLGLTRVQIAALAGVSPPRVDQLIRLAREELSKGSRPQS